MALDGTNPGVAAAQAASAQLGEARSAVVEIVGETERGIFDVPKAPPTIEEKEELLRQAKESARSFAEGDAATGLIEPYAARYREAQAVAATFADHATLENIDRQRHELDGADLGAVYNYTPAILMLAVLGIFGMGFALLLKRADRKQGYGLDLPSKQGA
jgi:hypothetical protein